MRPPWLQIETEFIRRVAGDLGVLLAYLEGREPDNRDEAVAGWGAQKVFLWALERCPSDEPPSAHDTLSGPAAARLMARAAGYRGDPAQLLAAYVEVRLVELVGEGGAFRIRGLRRYDDAWAKKDRERAARWAAAHPGWGFRQRRYVGDRIQPTAVQSVVYFIQVDRTGPIKIGFSSDLAHRLHSLQKAHCGTLHVLATIPDTGPLRVEKSLHRRFKHLRLRGEWFRDAPELLEYIRSLS